MNDRFTDYHPVVNLFYFTVVIGITMFVMHPAYLLISVISGLTYSIYLNGKKAVAFNLKYMMPMLVVSALINPAFNHEGSTILMYLKDGNPLTLESIVYGIVAALMIIAVITWFSCYNNVMTSDKFIYLFGRVIPAMSLIISMSLRFIPRFKAQIKVVSNGQKCLGRDVADGPIYKRVIVGLKILSIMTTWALENAIDTGDSMRSRGYGLPGRTAFSIYRFDKRDQKALTALIVLWLLIFIGWGTGYLYYRYFPSFKGVIFEPASVLLYLLYSILCNIPLIINVSEDRKWKALESRI